LGNQFLSHIRETDAIIQVMRAFEDGNITHVHGKIDPQDDSDVINLELVMADWQTVSKRLDRTKKSAKGVVSKDLQKELALLEKLDEHLQAGYVARTLEYSDDEKILLRDLHLLTMKPMMYVVNVTENNIGNIKNYTFDAPYIEICAKTEAELAELSEDDAVEFMKELGIEQSGLDKLIVAGYQLLQLLTYFTSGEKETRAWTVQAGTFAPDAAGVIHTDFVKGFIKADVVQWKDFVEAGGWSKIKETGKMKLVGKDYEVHDGDVIYFHVAT